MNWIAYAIAIVTAAAAIIGAVVGFLSRRDNRIRAEQAAVVAKQTAAPEDRRDEKADESILLQAINRVEANLRQDVGRAEASINRVETHLRADVAAARKDASDRMNGIDNRLTGIDQYLRPIDRAS